MSGHLSLSIHWYKEVKRAEKEAWMMREVTNFSSFGATPEQWIETFGDTEQDLEEFQSFLARKYHRTPWWKRRARRQILASYIKIKAILTVAHGMETVWR